MRKATSCQKHKRLFFQRGEVWDLREVVCGGGVGDVLVHEEGGVVVGAAQVAVGGQHLVAAHPARWTL